MRAKLFVLLATALFGAAFITTCDESEAHAALICHDGRMPCEPKQEDLDLAGEDYYMHLYSAFSFDETFAAVFEGGFVTPRFMQDVVIELVKMIRAFENQASDLLWENARLEEENIQLREKIRQLEDLNEILLRHNKRLINSTNKKPRTRVLYGGCAGDC